MGVLGNTQEGITSGSVSGSGPGPWSSLCSRDGLVPGPVPNPGSGPGYGC